VTAPRPLASAALALALGGAALPAGAAAAPEIAGLEAGRAVWLGTCQACHAEPDSGAPQLGDAAAWRARAARGRDPLYAHAMHGFTGPGGDRMLARGGNPALGDGELRAAVDYMLAASGQ